MHVPPLFCDEAAAVADDAPVDDDEFEFEDELRLPLLPRIAFDEAIKDEDTVVEGCA